MNLEQIKARLAEIRSMLESGAEDLDIAELTAEVDSLEEQRSAIEARSALESRVAAGSAGVRTLRSFPRADERETEVRTFGADSAEYRAAWLKQLMHESTGEWRFGELNVEERAAWTHTTANTPNVVPVAVTEGILDLITEQYALLHDLNITNIGGVIEIVRNTGIAAGTPGKVTEGAANADDAKFVFDKIKLAGAEYKGHVKITRLMQVTSMAGFEQYLQTTLAEQLGEQMNKDLWTMLDAAGGILSTNKQETTAGLTDADVRKAFAALKGIRGRRVYANNATIWNHIAGVEDDSGKKLFIASTMADDPAFVGMLYGAPVRLDDTLPDNVYYTGDPARIRANRFAAMESMSDTSAETFVTTHGIIDIFEAALVDARSFAKVTITPAV